MDNPWGAEDDGGFSSASLARPPSPRPTLSVSSSGATSGFASSGWGDDQGDSWGSAVIDYAPGFSAGAAGVEVTTEEGVVDREEEGESYSTTGGGGWGAGSSELPRLSLPSGEGPTTGFAPSPPLPPVSLASPSSPPSLPAFPDSDPVPTLPTSSPTLSPPEFEAEAEEVVDDGRGWGGGNPDDLDLPPLASLQITPAPSSPSATRSEGWVEPSSSSGWEPPEIPLPLPTFGDAFEKGKDGRGRRESDGGEIKEDGEEAWGSAKGWEERQRREREIEEEEIARHVAEVEARAAADAAEGFRPRDLDAEQPPSAPITSRLSSILPKLKSTSSARSSSEAQRPTSAAGQTGEQAAQKGSWWSRKNADEPAVQQEEEEDPRSLGVEEVQQGDSGRTASPQPEQPGAVGRFLSRWKRPASAPVDGEQQHPHDDDAAARAQSDGVEFNADDFDVLTGGGVGRVAQAKREEQDVDDALGGFFGDRLARVALAPPEDDFGGLFGAFSAPPANPVSRQHAARKPLDAFDPLSDSFGSSPAKPQGRSFATPALSPAYRSASAAFSTARTAVVTQQSRPSVNSFHSLAPPKAAPAPQPASTSVDESFDDFFNSVAASTKPSANNAVVPPPPVVAPTPRSRPTAILTSSSSSSRPPPRTATMSPPLRSATISPVSSSSLARSSTPILPLAPPPPPSQPLAYSRGGGSGGLISIAPPPSSSSGSLPPPVPVVSRTNSPFSAAPLAPSPVGGGLKPQLASQQQKGVTRSSSGPLSMDDLSFFEN